MSEAEIHFRFHRYLQNAIEDDPDRGEITYGHAHPEYSKDIDGRADIVVFDSNDDPLLVIEAKRPGDGGSRDIDPWARSVIQQAFRYAGQLGAPFFATYNEERLVIFDAWTEGVPLPERYSKSFLISNVEDFAGTLLDVVADLRAGDERWDAVDTAFIDRVTSFHEYISPRLNDALTDHLEGDSGFYESFSDWVAAQGIDYDDMESGGQMAVREEFAEQAAYLLINKIIFYKILENSPTYEEDVDPLAVSPYRVQEDLQDFFKHIVESVDFEAVYEHDPVYSEIPLDPVADKVREFILELDERDLTQFDSDVIGHIYQGVIPVEKRREMGEYYTPPEITNLITRLTITDAGNRVLDPACGSGGFLVSAYHRIRDLLPEPAGSHERILSQLAGVEINRFPAHLTVINLAIQDLSEFTHEVNVEVSDFFDIKRYQRFGRERATAEGGESEEDLTDQVDKFDAVVANPPYIRQENIESKPKVRDHLSSHEIDAEYISKRSDIYVYFITHATEFLNDNGRLGYIISDRWLDTKYGSDLQTFLLNNYSINAIIQFDRQVFDDALIDSTVLYLTKEPSPEQRDATVTKFLRVKQELEIDDIANIVEQDEDPDKLISAPEYRLATRLQAELHEEDKWNLFFNAPPIYFEIDAATTTELDDLAELSYGAKTGANDFFCLQDDEPDDFGVREYTSPLLKASGQITQIAFVDEIAEEWRMLDVHELVEEAQADIDEAVSAGDETVYAATDNEAERVKQWLRRNDHSVLADYIETGEARGFHERKSVQSRRYWFDLGDLDRPPIFIPEFTWRVFRAAWNVSEGVATNKFYNVDPGDEVDDEVLAGVLNSRVVWLMVELRGRWTGGQGLDRIDLMLYEARQLPVPDVRDASTEQADRIRDAFHALVERERELDDVTLEDVSEERRELDEAVLALIDSEDRVDELEDAITQLIRARERSAGQHTEVLVGRLEETGQPTTVELPGVAEARERTTLDDF